MKAVAAFVQLQLVAVGSVTLRPALLLPVPVTPPSDVMAGVFRVTVTKVDIVKASGFLAAS